MRPLTAALATACETARSTRCQCRCRGQAHGLARFDTEQGALELPAGDPHYPRGAPGPAELESPPREVPPGPGALF